MRGCMGCGRALLRHNGNGLNLDRDVLGEAGQGLRLLHRVSVKGPPVTSLPRACDSDEWVATHVRGYRSPGAVVAP